MTARRRSPLALATLLLVACWPERPEWTAPASLLGLEPAGPVAATAPVQLRFSRAVRPATPRWPVSVLRADGRPVALELPTVAWTDRLPLRPAGAWPSGETLTVRLDGALVDEEGRAVPGPEPAPSFVIESATPAPELRLRGPRPGEPWPTNLRWVALERTPPDGSIEAVWLEGGGQRLMLEVARREGALLLVALPHSRGACLPLCPATRHHLVVEAGGGLLTRVEALTSTAPDLRPPRLHRLASAVRGAALSVDVESDEPVLVRGWARSLQGEEVALVGPPIPGRVSRLEASAPLRPDAVHLVWIEAEDLAGHAAEPLYFEVQTQAVPELRISELVLSPLRDWGDSEPAGVPFDASPGQGAVSAADQWVEVVNRGPAPIDLRVAGISARAIDTSPSETWLDSAPAHYFGSGGDLSRWWPGEALVLRLRGQMSKTKLVLELRQGEAVLDRVEIGRSSAADHVGGSPPDFEHEAVARDATGRFRFCVPSPGDPAPPVRCLLR